MVNTQMLEKAITDSGKTKRFLADRLGRSVQSFRLKRTNANFFNTDEVAILCDELDITKLSDKEKIFFAKNVEKMPT